jgi:hypothetical protein
MTIAELCTPAAPLVRSLAPAEHLHLPHVDEPPMQASQVHQEHLRLSQVHPPSLRHP